MPADIAGVYSGDFPCGNCTAIAATLWLRPDHAFFFRQVYLSDDSDDARAYALGRWRWDEIDAQIVLDGAGPERRFSQTEGREWQLDTLSPLPHRLARNDAALPFTDRIQLEGLTTFDGNRATFTECLTGLELEIATDGAFTELRRQYRRLSPNGAPVLTEIDAHLRNASTPDGPEILALDRVLGLKPGASC